MVKVEPYYEKKKGQWGIVSKDQSGKQLGEIIYVTHVREALNETKRIRKLHGVNTI